MLGNSAIRAVNLEEPEFCILNILKWSNLVFLILCVEKTRVWPGSVCFGVFKYLGATLLALLLCSALSKTFSMEPFSTKNSDQICTSVVFLFNFNSLFSIMRTIEK